MELNLTKDMFGINIFRSFRAYMEYVYLSNVRCTLLSVLRSVGASLTTSFPVNKYYKEIEHTRNCKASSKTFYTSIYVANVFLPKLVAPKERNSQRSTQCWVDRAQLTSALNGRYIQQI